jgi:hypothetical protein
MAPYQTRNSSVGAAAVRMWWLPIHRHNATVQQPASAVSWLCWKTKASGSLEPLRTAFLNLTSPLSFPVFNNSSEDKGYLRSAQTIPGAVAADGQECEEFQPALLWSTCLKRNSVRSSRRRSRDQPERMNLLPMRPNPPTASHKSCRTAIASQSKQFIRCSNARQTATKRPLPAPFPS